MQIRFLGCHHTETASTRLSSLLVDQVLALDAGAITSTTIPAEQDLIQAVLLTHQHLDHIRDVPTLALNGLGSGKSLPIFGSQETLSALQQHLLNGAIYPDFTQMPQDSSPRIKLYPLEMGKTREICGYQVTAMPVIHCEGSVGFLVQSPRGRRLFYTGDTNGEGLAGIWECLKPDLVVVEVTFPNAEILLASLTNHMTPDVLASQIALLKNSSQGPLPRFVISHVNSQAEAIVHEELKLLSRELGIPLTPAWEGMTTEV